ncbi:sigma-54-dependent transcriptional regulator [Rubrimonas cliftonensis]|uniref:Nif-specific regulatory protein n=1 Tax=Rubrimonas cliftonensis TaxID=89524 RepID=A0A1H4DXC0_9RHOB|nr:sigma-54 dependent transcriptional regulator [Rubrimonas cliftonensis]SEA76852.1 two component, sigma54 specific, transcriptional regulator, Fis family [Rubrimonas cliftonensis]
MAVMQDATGVGPILLVEDTPSLSAYYAALLRKAGLDVHCAMTAAEAVARHSEHRHRVVLLDLMLPDGDGLDVLREMRAADPDVAAIVITANGSINRAVAAMRGGAHDFLVKPFDEARLLRSVEAAVAMARAPSGPRVAETRPGLAGFIGSSETMREIQETVREVARSTATVFITGESGTGKEVCAQAIHAESPRRDAAFIPLNCGAIPRDLIESEVFGHLKGSFTGAIADKPGAAQAADGGTLFLDEVCEMEPNLQTKLLRFLQSGSIQPVGSATARKVDVRIVCATNRDPQAEVAAGRFRSDLFYRLFVVPVHLPPLRERGRDVVEIGEALLARYAGEEGKAFRRLSPEVEAAFLGYGWPGNIRELQNVLRNIAVLRDGDAVTLSMLPDRIAEGAASPARLGDGLIDPASAAAPPTPAADAAPPLRDRLRPLVGAALAQMEREFIEATIEACEGSIPRAARILEVSPSTLYRKREGWTKG